MMKNFFRMLFGRKKEKIEEEKDLTDMSKREKKEFLSNDFIHRMIRVEKEVSSSFGEDISYEDTRYYKSLSENEKKKYKKYLNNKKKKKFFIIFPLVLLIGVFIFLRVGITGDVVQENFGDGVFLIESYFMVFVIFVIVFLGIFFVKKRFDEKRFCSNFKVLEDININRYLINKEGKRRFLP